MQFSLRQYRSEAASHSHTDFHQIIISDLGLLELEIEGRGGAVSGTRLAFVPAGDTHAYRAQGLNRFLVLDVDTDLAKRAGIEALWHRNANASPYLQIANGQQAALSDLLRTVTSTRQAGAPISLTSRVGDCGTLIDDLSGEEGIVCNSLLRVLAGTSAASVGLTSKASNYDGLASVPPRLQRVLDWAELRLADPISVSDMAAVAVQSESSFFDAFQRYIGTTPMRWLTEQRLLAARHLLMASGKDIAIGDLAAQVGFTDQSAFSRAFSRRFGCSPLKMRMQGAVDLTAFN
ncbi:helix-turn-helix domain-containing protein [Thalassospira lucentensis]|uniref:helix-turn-helix domain-containing protein n=1 Tax=Thalassospira lucentensis TaxID=168935 RepID=UPI003AA98B33